MKARLLRFRREATHARTTKTAAAGPMAVAHAFVVGIDGAQATRVRFATDGRSLPVASHADAVPALAIGDQVLIADAGDEAVVMARLRSDGEGPAALPRTENGETTLAGEHLVLSAGSMSVTVTPDGIVLSNGEGTRLQLDAEGHARLDGRKLALTGSEDVFVDGHRIRLG